MIKRMLFFILFATNFNVQTMDYLEEITKTNMLCKTMQKIICKIKNYRFYESKNKIVNQTNRLLDINNISLACDTLRNEKEKSPNYPHDDFLSECLKFAQTTDNFEAREQFVQDTYEKYKNLDQE